MDKTSLVEWLRELKPAGGSEHRRLLALPGVIIVVLSIVASLASFLIMIGVTPIIPDLHVTLALIIINVVLVVSLLALIIREIYRITQARRHGRAAARLHVRIVALFSLIAAVPAIVVAIVASVTLNLGLDRWFETNTRNIVNSSISLANGYLTDTARNLQSATYSMLQDMDGQRTLYSLDRNGFVQLLTLQALGRGLLGAQLLREDGSIAVHSERGGANLPQPPPEALETAKDGNPVIIPPAPPAISLALSSKCAKYRMYISTPCVQLMRKFWIPNA